MRHEVREAVKALEQALPRGSVHAVAFVEQDGSEVVFPLLAWARDGSDTSTLYEGGHSLPMLALTAYGVGIDGHEDADALMDRALAVLREGGHLAEEPDDPFDEYEVEPQTYSVDVSVKLRSL